VSARMFGASTVVRRVSLTVSISSLSLLLAACGGTVTGASGTAKGGACTAAPVLKQVDGLDQAARTAKLKDLAAKETGDFQIYGTMGATPDVVKPFEKEYGLKVTYVDLDSEELMQRLQTEQAAGKPQASILAENGADLQLGDTKGTLADITTPFADDLPKATVYSDWISNELNVYGVLRNTDKVPDSEAPKTWEDLADSKYDGRIGIPSGSFDLTAAIIPYMEQHDGLSEKAAIDVWTKVFKGAKIYSDEPALADAVQRGELDFGIDYIYFQSQLEKAGSKNIAWEPTVTPLVARPNGLAIPCGSPRPASGLLLLDWLLSKEGQQSWGNASGRDVTNPKFDIGALRGKTYDILYEDLITFAKDSKKWVGVHNDLLNAAR
jgi:iron(III) transport system substrate-binding protein